MKLQIVFAVVGTVAGALYSILGLLASRHPASSTSLSGVDKVVGWTLWWWIEGYKYNPKGRRLCAIGGVLFVIAVVCWAMFYALD